MDAVNITGLPRLSPLRTTKESSICTNNTADHSLLGRGKETGTTRGCQVEARGGTFRLQRRVEEGTQERDSKGQWDLLGGVPKWIWEPPPPPHEAKEWALGAGCGGWLGQRVSRGEGAWPALPGASVRHSGAQRSGSAPLSTESGLEFPEGCLADLPLLFLPLPLILLCF